MKGIFILIKKEFILEWRQRFALNGLMLHLLGILMMLYVSFMETDVMTWTVLLWIIIFFTSISASAKSFTLEPYQRYLYYYSLIKPQQLIFAKIIYNSVLLSFLSLLTWMFYSIILGDNIYHKALFLMILLLGSVSISTLLTLMSAIASKSGNSSTVMSVLSLPLLIPILLLLIKISLYTTEATAPSFPYRDFVFLLSLNGILLMLAYLLFPFIYRD